MLTRFSPGQETLRRLAFFSLVLLIGIAFLACGGDKKAPEGTIPLKMTTTDGDTKELFVEVAASAQERGVGLSKRTELGADRGMLFIIPTRGLGFWMKDTLIPLSVAFIGPCGEIVFIDDMEPQTETLHNTDKDYKFGLEANKGWFARNGITEGATVEIPAEYQQPECV
jgi:uncharacterized membrane protein (UPF0127 family)